MSSFRQLVLNFGSTSTKFAVYEDEAELYTVTLRFSAEQLAPFREIYDQIEFREKPILDALASHGDSLEDFDAIIGRGGFIRAMGSGTVLVNDAVCADLRSGVYGKHAANLGGLVAKRLADRIGKPAFIADPVVVDEFDDIARVSGYPLIENHPVWHALNQKAVAKAFAKRQGRRYEDMNLIVAHLGGGVSVGAHKLGRAVDVSNALDGGPFSPERSGTLPLRAFVKLCYSGKFTESEMVREMNGRAGLVGYLGTNDAREVVARIKAGDEYAKLIYSAMAYQIAKEIGSMAVVLKGCADAIIITGGLAYDKLLTDMITDSVSFLAPVTIVPGEDELWALAMGGLSVLRGEELALVYEDD